MDAIREAHQDTPLVVPGQLPMPGTKEMDVRGEMLIYRENDRSTGIIRALSKGNHLYPASLTRWWYANERISVPFTPEMKERTLQRFLHYASIHIGVVEVV